MEVLEGIEVVAGRRIELCRGDLAHLDDADSVDLLLVSAFRDDYVPTPSSLIGALARSGLNVEELAGDKLADLRETTSCWLSRPIPEGRSRYGFGQLMCFEPAKPQAAAETVGDIFRALVPFVGGAGGSTSVAMPVLAAGDMGQSREGMTRVLLDAAIHWMSSGLPLERLHLVVRDSGASVQAAFRAVAESYRTAAPTEPEPVATHDIFISYAHEDGTDAAGLVVEAINARGQGTRVFLDHRVLQPGVAWQQAIYDSLNSCRLVVPILTPGYLASKMCQEELNIARVRALATPGVLHPLYAITSELPAHIKVLQYADCRECDADLIDQACASVLNQLEH